MLNGTRHPAKGKRPDVKDKGGRPTLFHASFNRQAHKLCLLGATDVQLADFFGVSEVTLNAWKHKYPTFLKSITRGKLAADATVAESLYSRANGYSHEAVKIMQHDGAAFEHRYREHYPPDTTACVFWLKNRQPAIWRDKQDHEHSGPGGGPIATLALDELGADEIEQILAQMGAKAAA